MRRLLTLALALAAIGLALSVPFARAAVFPPAAGPLTLRADAAVPLTAVQ